MHCGVVIRLWVARVTEAESLVYALLHKGPIWIQKFNAMVRFYLNTFLLVADACEVVNHK